MRTRMLAAIGAAGCILFGLYAAVASVAFSPRFYLSAYERHNVTQTAGISEEALRLVTADLIAYMRGTLPALDRQVSIDGTERNAFGLRERVHMADVRGLFTNGRKLAFAALAIGLLSLFISHRRRNRRALGIGMLCGLCVWLITLGGLGIWAAVDFEGVFTLFHHISFDNDLWLLDPNTELLIRLMPTGFFIDAVKHIGLRIGAVLLCFAVAGIHLVHKGGRTL